MSSPTLNDVYNSVRMLQQLSQTLVGQQVVEPKTPGQAILGWVRKNITWLLGGVLALFLAYQEARDQWRDNQRDAEEYRLKTDKAIEDTKLQQRLHEVDAKQGRQETKRALRETHVGAMEAFEQVQKEIRIVHPSLERRAPKESPLLQKAKASAKDEEANRNLFPDVHLPAAK